MIEENKTRLLPTAAELHETPIPPDILGKQGRGLEVISRHLRRYNRLGVHEITLYARYLMKTYCIDITWLANMFIANGYAVTTNKDGFNMIDSITVKW